MKKTISLALFIIAVSALLYAAEYSHVMKRVNRAYAPTVSPSSIVYLKAWNKGVTKWSSIDTFQTVFLNQIKLGAGADSNISYAFTSSTTLAYRLAIKIQFGNLRGWRPAVFLDSAAQGGNTAPIKTAYDSGLVGRPIYHIIKSGANAGADRFRFIVGKDTANTGGTSQKYQVTINYNEK